jgi:hypothetical protein
MEAVCSSDTSVLSYESSWCCNSESLHQNLILPGRSSASFLIASEAHLRLICLSKPVDLRELPRRPSFSSNASFSVDKFAINAVLQVFLFFRFRMLKEHRKIRRNSTGTQNPGFYSET